MSRYGAEKASYAWTQFVTLCRSVAEGDVVPHDWKRVSASQNYRSVYRIDSTPERRYVSLWDNANVLDTGERSYYSLAVIEARYEAESLAKQLRLQKRNREIQDLHLVIPSLHSERALLSMPDYGKPVSSLIVEWYRAGAETDDSPMSPREFLELADGLNKLPLFHPDFNLHGTLSRATEGKRVFTSVDNTLLYALGICFEANYDQVSDTTMQLFAKMQKMFA